MPKKSLNLGKTGLTISLNRAIKSGLSRDVKPEVHMNVNVSPTDSPEGNFLMSNIIDSLKRLERVGSENSKTTQKLIEAARELAESIVKQFAVAPTESIRLRTSYQRAENSVYQPTRFRGYMIVKGRLVSDNGYVALNRENALLFSKDIANGLLDLLGEILEEWREATEQGLAVIQAAEKKIQ